MKLKIELYRYETVLFGKIVEQDESLRNKTSTSQQVICKNTNFSIVSYYCPYLVNNMLSIRGKETGLDNAVFYYDFDTVDDAIKASREIISLINEINSEEDKDMIKVERLI